MMRRVFLAGCSLVFAVSASAQTPFSHSGVDGLHPGSSVLPNEQVDPASGNLTVVATDLVLPGNAGLDIRVTRVYNSAVYPDYTNGSTQIEEDSWAGIGWKLHFGRVLNNESVVEMGDGSRHALHTGLSGGWITTDFWLYDKTTHTLKLPNGLVYQFDREVSLNGTLGTTRYVTEIRDPYNNRLTFSYFSAPGPLDGVAQIHQDLGGGQIRDVTFTYDATLNTLASMSYGGRTWTYQHQAAGPSGFSHLTHVTPPIGPGWSYEYGGMAGELTRLITPSGGYVSYAYADSTRRAGSLAQLSRVVASRTTGGPDIVGGTWTYTYSTGSNQDTTVVTCPCGTQTFRFNGTGLSGNFSGWLAGTLDRRTIEDNGVVLESQNYFYAPSETISNDSMPGVSGVWTNPDTRIALLSQTIVTRGPTSWTTTPLYHAGNYNDYGRPYQIEEGESTYQFRRTVRTFQYGFTPYIVDRIASESVLIKTSYEDVSAWIDSSWAYEPATGFLSSQNLFGITSSFERSAEGNVSASIDALGNRTTYAFSWGVQNDVHPPPAAGSSGSGVYRVINADGTVASEGNDVDVASLYTYDDLGRLTWVRQSGFNGSTTEYDLVNNRFVRVGAGPASQTTYTLDGFGRVISSVDLTGLRTRVERDACGRVTFSSAPYTTGSGTRGTARQFDVLGRVTQETTPAGSTTYSYSGLSVTRTDAANRATVFEYRAFGGPESARLMSVGDATNVTTSYVYDVHGNLTKVVGPSSGLARTWDRGPSGLVVSDTQPEAGTTQYTYDAAGNLTQTTDANQQTTTYQYYPDGRLKLRDAPGTQDDLTITYDPAGRAKTLQGPTSGIIFTYNSRGLLASRTDAPIAGTVFTSSYGYDADNLLTTITYPSTRSVTYEFGTEHRLTNVRQNGALFANAFTYDDAGRLASYQTGAVTHSFGYDAADRPSHLLSSSSAGSLDLTYTYDGVGNVQSIADPRPGANQNFTVDSLDRLVTADGPWGHLGWTYDANGNRLTQTGSAPTTYTYNPTTQRLLSSSGAVTENFSYDNAGRLTSDSFGTYTYTGLGLLASATRTGMSATYAYDNAGGRLSRSVNGQTTYSIRSADGAVLSEYLSPCSGSLLWDRDLIYAGGRLLGAVRSVATTPPTVSVTSSSLSAGESAGSLTVSFTLATPGGVPLSCPVTAAYHTTTGTATPGADFTDSTGTVLFPAGSVSGATQSIVIPILTDTLYEGNETFFVDLSSASGGSIGSGRTTVTVVDDDSIPPTVSVSDASVTEGNGGSPTLVFTVTLSATSGQTVSVNYATTPNTATAGVDYTSTSGTVTFAPGVTSQTVSVSIIPDTLDEPDESVLLNLTAPVNATLADAQGRGVIHDDDPPGPPAAKDFNGDGWPDLVWRRLVTGENSLWWMSGASPIGTALLEPAGVASPIAAMNWEIRAVGDFNGDGKPDLLWQDQTTGDVSVWFLNNHVLVAASWPSLLSGTHGDPDTNWKIVGAADMNADGQLDLVWQNRQTTALRVWHMDGVLQLDSVPLSTAPGDPQWEIGAVADMNGDGRPDLVWRHYGTGAIAAWLLQDTQVLGGVWLTPDTVSDVTWRIVGAVDLNADGQTDLIWQRVSGGELSVWYMNGTVAYSTIYLGGSPVTDTNWRIVGVR